MPVRIVNEELRAIRDEMDELSSCSLESEQHPHGKPIEVMLDRIFSAIKVLCFHVDQLREYKADDISGRFD